MTDVILQTTRFLFNDKYGHILTTVKEQKTHWSDHLEMYKTDRNPKKLDGQDGHPNRNPISEFEGFY